MAPLAIASDWLTAHHALGASTGYMADARGNWARLAARCLDRSIFAAEFSALGEDELPGLLEFLGQDPPLPFHHLSVHAPTKRLRLPEPELVARLATLTGRVDGIVAHPDVLRDLRAWAPLGRTLLIENMDGRKAIGRTVAELAPVFEQLPDAGFCLDVAHVSAVDPSMALGHELLDAFGDRLREVHLSSLDADGHHVPLTDRDRVRFGAIMRRCPDVPWILEAPLPDSPRSLPRPAASSRI